MKGGVSAREGGNKQLGEGRAPSSFIPPSKAPASMPFRYQQQDKAVSLLFMLVRESKKPEIKAIRWCYQFFLAV